MGWQVGQRPASQGTARPIAERAEVDARSTPLRPESTPLDPVHLPRWARPKTRLKPDLGECKPISAEAIARQQMIPERNVRSAPGVQRSQAEGLGETTRYASWGMADPLGPFGCVTPTPRPSTTSGGATGMNLPLRREVSGTPRNTRRPVLPVGQRRPLATHRLSIRS